MPHRTEGFVSLLNINLTAPNDLEKLAAILQPDVYDAVRWACLRYLGGVHDDEIDDLSQQVILKLIEDGCRRLHSFEHNSSFKTWLQIVVNHHVCKHLYRRKRAEHFGEVDQGALIYLPPQDRDVYSAEKRTLLFRALGMLSEQERLLYRLWFVYELDPISIAAVLETEVRVIYKRKQTLVLKLKRLVQSFQTR
jgi:RNA polymerase sigma factor (sigma-70 family)